MHAGCVDGSISMFVYLRVLLAGIYWWDIIGQESLRSEGKKPGFGGLRPVGEGKEGKLRELSLGRGYIACGYTHYMWETSRWLIPLSDINQWRGWLLRMSTAQVMKRGYAIPALLVTLLFCIVLYCSTRDGLHRAVVVFLQG